MKQTIRTHLLASTTLAIATIAGSGHAFAADTMATETNVEEVVVTGSHIVRQDYVADSPIVTVGTQALQNTGSVTVETLLNQIPQFVPSVTSTSNNPSNGGQANVELRGLGTKRTVVLVDGRRITPSNADGTVDLNTIPSALIENIEVITGGASTAYGSDAIAGVVNFKLRKHFTGVELDAQYGQTGHNDGATQDFSATLGSDFADNRGNAVISFNYSNREGILNANRKFSAVSGLSGTTPYGQVDAVGTNLWSQAAVTALFANNYHVTDVANSVSLGVNPDKSLFVLSGKDRTGASVTGVHYKGSNDIDFSTIPTIGAYNTGALNLLTIPLTRYSAFARGDYEINAHATAYAQASYTTYDSKTQLAPSPAFGNPTTGGNGFWVPVTNPFIPDDLKPLLASRGNPNAPILVRTRFTNLGPRISDNKYNVLQLLVGVRGSLGVGDFTYDVYGSYGKDSQIETQFGNVSHAAARTLLEASDGGASLCAGGYNPFGLAPVSAECKAFLQRTTKNTTDLEERIIEGTVQGGLFALPAGEVRIAVGAYYKSDKFDFLPDSVLSTEDVSNNGPGLENNAPGVIGFNGQDALSGFTDVKEIYGEALIPVLKDLPLIRQFNVDVAARYSDWNTVGGVSTYKADGEWTVVDSLLIRGGYSRAIRAPSIGELFLPNTQDFPQIGLPTTQTPFAGDPCDVRSGWRTGANAAKVRALCIAQGLPAQVADTYQSTQQQVQGVLGGNPNLKEETSNTWSVGAAWSPKFEAPLLRRLHASVDYYDISVADAIGTIGSATTLANCFNGGTGTEGTNADFSTNNVYCALIHRDSATGEVASIVDTEGNLGSIKTSGVDFQVDWGFDLEALGLSPSAGALAINLIGTRTIKYDVQNIPGGDIDHRVGTIDNTVASAFPKWKFLTSVTWEVGKFELGGTWRYIGEVDDFRVGGQAAPAINYIDLNARWKINDTIEFRGGVNNVGDKQPPVYTSSVQANTDPSTYDVLGRRWYLGVRARF